MEPEYESRGDNSPQPEAGEDISDGHVPSTDWEGYSPEILDGLLDA